MANDYLTLAQVCETLGKTEEEVHAMVADGRLGELREGDDVFYRKSDVDQIAAKEGSSIVDLAMTEDAEPTESFASALSSLMDDSSGLGVFDEPENASEAPAVGEEAAMVEPQAETTEPPRFGSGGIAELSLEDIPEDLPAAPAADLDAELQAPAVSQPLDAAAGAAADEIPDLGLSGSSILGLEPAKEEPPADEKPPTKESIRPSKVGISVFDDDEIEIESDPMGETQITPGVTELESVGSGSGLLDLTRETDDTSLGADLLDVISPSEAAETIEEGQAVEVAEADDTVEDSGPEMTVVEEEGVAGEPLSAMAMAPRVATAPISGAVWVNSCVLLGIIAIAALGLAAAGQLQQVWPEPLSLISKGVVHYSVFGGLALVSIVLGVLGILAGKNR